MILRMEFLQESPEGMCDVLSVPYLLRTTEGGGESVRAALTSFGRSL